MIKATIIADSISAHTNQRITTFELEYHRYIHGELMTHRQFSRNASSSRAIPIDKMIEQVENNPAYPIHWGANQSGMQADKQIVETGRAKQVWEIAKEDAIYHAKKLQALGLHKQVVNRVLEPFQMMKTLVTATNYDNFFNLRCHKDAQPEIKQLADLMYQALQESKPEVLRQGEWHTPYVYHTRNEQDVLMYYVLGRDGEVQYLTVEEAIKISCSCSAQVSYRKNDTSIEKALAIYDRLVGSEPKHCYDVKTEVLTEQGFKLWSDVTSDDKLAVVSPDTNKFIGFKQPLTLTADYYDGLMLNVERKNISMSITPNHKIYGFQRRTSDAWNSRQGKYYLYVAEEPTNSLSDKLNYQVMQAIPTCTGGVESQGNQADFRLGQLYGFFIGDGFIPKDSPNRLCFRLKKQRKIDYIQTVLTNLNLPINNKRYADGVTVIKTNPSQSFEDCYDCNRSKKFPNDWLNKSQEFLLGLFDGLINSDGWTDPRRKDTYSFSTTSKDVADSMVILCAIAGIGSCSIYENKKNEQSKLVYQVSVRKAKEAIINDSRNPNSYVKPIPYKGMVYCADTGGNVLIVRRNGNVFLSGNSSAFEHCATPIDIERTNSGITHFTINDVPCSGNFTNWVQYRQLIKNHDCKEYAR